MDIEGLNATETKKDGFVEASFVPQGQHARRHISLKVSPKGSATVELLEGKHRPGIENGEFIPIAVYTEDIGDRVVRAMAKVHFGLDEAATGYTATDADMISRGFNIGRGSGTLPVWITSNGTHFTVVAKTAAGGLPSSPKDPACLVFGRPNGRRVTVNAETLDAALKMLDSGQLPQLLNPVSDIEMNGVYSKGDATVH